MNLFRYLLSKLASMQKKYPMIILVFFLLFSAFMGVGFFNVKFQGDMSKEMPTHLPIYQLNDKITDKFGGQDTIFVLFQINDELEKKALYNDIREPAILDYMVELENSLIHESSVDDVISVATYYKKYKQSVPNPTLEDTVSFFKSNPVLQNFVNSDYKIAIMMIKADVGSGEEKVSALTKMIDDRIKALSTPSGVKIQVTGTPNIIVEILRLLRHDSVYTIMLASLIIFGLLLVTINSFQKTLVVFVPLLFGLFWTIGAMGWLNIKISVATAGLGAMVLGLGVEYGVFILSRYDEERKKGFNQEESIKFAIPAVGSAILGSGFTTMVGFLALTLSVLPMMQHLGLSLAIGIAFSIIAAIILEPAIMILQENFDYWLVSFNEKNMKRKKQIHARLKK